MLLKTFLASLAAKIAVGTGLTIATVTAAGAGGVLPEPARHAVASVVEAATPFALADPLPGAAQVGDDLTTTSTSTTVAGEEDSDGTDATRKQNHGACVSTVAKNVTGPDKGKTVSSVARSDCGKKSATTTTVPGSSTTSSSTTSTTVAGSSTTSSTLAAERSANSGAGSANSSRGNSGNSANSGPGNSAKK